MAMTAQSVVQKVQGYCMQREMNLSAFRARVKIPKNTWATWKRGTVNPSVGELAAMCDDLQISMLGLLLADDKPSAVACLARVVSQLPDRDRDELVAAAKSLVAFYER